jgi:hypothetical protein
VRLAEPTSEARVMTSPTFSLKISVLTGGLHSSAASEGQAKGGSRPTEFFQATGAWLIAHKQRRPGPQPMRFRNQKPLSVSRLDSAPSHASH